MHARDLLIGQLKSTQELLGMYLSDLSDADLLVRPVPNANHIAWQVGHLVSSEQHMLAKELPQVKFPALSEEFEKIHSQKNTDGNQGFLTKDEYLKLFNGTREAVIGAVAQLSDAEIDKPQTGKMAAFVPNFGSMFVLIANHTMMHAGQFSVVRRKLGKPIIM